MEPPIPPALQALWRARQTWLRENEVFLAGGGSCVYCRDSGLVLGADERAGLQPCEQCPRGETLRVERERQLVAALLAQSGAADFEGTPDSHPNRTLAGQVVAWGQAQPDRQHPFLLLHGWQGSGKSVLAAWLLREAIARTRQPGRFVPVTRMINDLRPTEMQSTELFDAALTLPLVVLDDVGRTPLGAGFVEERLFIVIDGRYAARRWTVITTNKDPREAAPPARALTSAVGPAIADRIVERSRALNTGGQQANLRRRGGIP